MVRDTFYRDGHKTAQIVAGALGLNGPFESTDGDTLVFQVGSNTFVYSGGHHRELTVHEHIVTASQNDNYLVLGKLHPRKGISNPNYDEASYRVFNVATGTSQEWVPPPSNSGGNEQVAEVLAVSNDGNTLLFFENGAWPRCEALALGQCGLSVVDVASGIVTEVIGLPGKAHEELRAPDMSADGGTVFFSQVLEPCGNRTYLCHEQVRVARLSG
jgi:hypothetical protein